MNPDVFDSRWLLAHRHTNDALPDHHQMAVLFFHRQISDSFYDLLPACWHKLRWIFCIFDIQLLMTIKPHFYYILFYYHPQLTFLCDDLCVLPCLTLFLCQWGSVIQILSGGSTEFIWDGVCVWVCVCLECCTKSSFWGWNAGSSWSIEKMVCMCLPGFMKHPVIHTHFSLLQIYIPTQGKEEVFIIIFQCAVILNILENRRTLKSNHE